MRRPPGVNRTRMNEASLFQMTTRMEEAFAQSDTHGLRRFWREQILKKPDVLKDLLRHGYLGVLIARVRALIAPTDDDEKHLILSVQYWLGHSGLGNYYVLSANNGWDDLDMAEEEPHGQFMAELVRDTAEAVAQIKFE